MDYPYTASSRTTAGGDAFFILEDLYGGEGLIFSPRPYYIRKSHTGHHNSSSSNHISSNHSSSSSNNHSSSSTTGSTRVGSALLSSSMNETVCPGTPDSRRSGLTGATSVETSKESNYGRDGGVDFGSSIRLTINTSGEWVMV